MLTNYEVFEKVKTHLLAQGVRSQIPGTPTCLYRGPGGLKCAVGALIEDEHFDAQFNNETVNDERVLDERVLDALLASGVNVKDENLILLLNELQLLHDFYAPEFWDAKLKSLKEEYFAEGTTIGV